MRQILKQSPIWVIGYDDDGSNHRTSTGFVRITSSDNSFVMDTSFCECSKWNTKEQAQEALKLNDEDIFFVYRVDEYEDGSDRLCLKLTKEQ